MNKIRPSLLFAEGNEEPKKDRSDLRLNKKAIEKMMMLGRPQLDVPPMLSHHVIELLENLSSTDSSDSFRDEDNDSSAPDSIGKNSKSNFANLKTNRQAFGTWTRELDFTLHCVGYIIGIHNFFRFPYLCYKFGALTFLIPYLILMILVGLPIVFMECTIGQYFGIGSITAFRQLAPVITGVSYILVWNSFIHCWLTGALITWIRVYSGDSLSCLKGWQGCSPEHYYNTPYCWTGPLDDCCQGHYDNVNDANCPPNTLDYAKIQQKNKTIIPESIYFNYECIEVREFCELFQWTHVDLRMCQDKIGKNHSIYKRRQHASSEYLYGYVFGMRKVFSQFSKNLTIEECLRTEIESKKHSCHSNILFESSEKKHFRHRVDKDPVNIKAFWSREGQLLQVDPSSSSFIHLPFLTFTSVLVITIFLFENLLGVSYVTYVFNGVPFLILAYVVYQAFTFEHYYEGVFQFLRPRNIYNLLTDYDIWIEAVVQVLVSTGVGSGALISLASFNKYRHSYKFDVTFVILLNIITSIAATLLCFCTIGHYMKTYGVTAEPFETFIRSSSEVSPVEFGYIVYSLFLTLIEGQYITTLLFFFMFTSFPTDTAIRLAQNILDATVHILPRLKHHTTMALLAVVTFYFLTLLPLTGNGAVYLFIEYEYFALHYVTPIVVFIEVVSVGWVYQASTLIDNAAELRVVNYHFSKTFLIIGLKYISPLALFLIIIGNLHHHHPERLKSQKPESKESQILIVLFEWCFCLTPIILFLLSVLKQLVTYPKNKWNELFVSTIHPELKRMLAHRMTRVNSSIVGLILPIIESKESIQDANKKLRIESMAKKQVLISSELSKQKEFDSEDKIKIEPNDHETMYQQKRSILKNKDTDKQSSSSIDSSELTNWKIYTLWNELLTYFEDWPERLEDSEVESEGSSSDTSDENRQIYHIHYPLLKPASQDP